MGSASGGPVAAGLPYPHVAVHDGSGDPDDAGSFVRGEGAIKFAATDWTGSSFFAPYEPRDI